MKTREGLQLVTLTFSRWNDHDAPRLGAALAYYTLLSIAPLVIIIVAIAGFVLGKTNAEGQLMDQTTSMLGANGAATLQMLTKSMQHQGSGVLATCIAIVTLFFGASGVFMELRDSLNTLWDTSPKNASTWRGIVWQRLMGFAMVLGVGLLLLILLLCGAAVQVVEKSFTDLVPMNPSILETLNVVGSAIAVAVLFALIFKYVPEASIIWRDVVIGAIVTAVLFTIGKFLLAWYLSSAGVGSAYGAAGSIVALVVWVYYSAQIFLFGAMFTRVYAEKYGSHAESTRGKAAQVG